MVIPPPTHEVREDELSISDFKKGSFIKLDVVDISDFKKGSFIKLDVVNPQCETYGALQIMSVKVIVEKFCTRWEDWGGYHRPYTDADYIDRQTIIITLKNEKAKVFE